ncbi:calcyphosin-2-like [Clavelina lepadiformis]|uniref:calcyphosin-2-like n=1 Tax=Clavelina lepadiformis TaxID=159417 RepID=UPI0040423B2D
MALHVGDQEDTHLRNPQKSPRPKTVPRLELGEIVSDLTEEKVLEKPIKKRDIVNSPSPRSAVSWGTPLSPPYALTSDDVRFGGTVHRPCTHIRHKGVQNKPISKNLFSSVSAKESNLKAAQTVVKFKNEQTKKETMTKPSKVTVTDTSKENFKTEKRVHTQEMKEGKKNRYWYLDDELKEKPPTPPPEDTGYTVDEMAQMQAEYTSQPYTGLHGARKFAAEDDLIKKQKEDVMEQVLIDQLSRHVLSDAEQDHDPARLNPADPASSFNTAPLRFRTRRLHESKVSTAGALTESKLKDKLTFGARILTRDGRDALRELFGFFFHGDQTITVYEFRLFGKNTNKALPVIKRGKYCHAVGRRKGKQYVPGDFQVGRNLTFLTNNQAHLPDSLKKSSVIAMRISETSAPSLQGTWDISSSDRDGGDDTARERKDRKITNDVQRYLRNKLRNRSVSVVVGLGRLFRHLDASGDGALSKKELMEALDEFDVSLPQSDFDSVWRVVDENNDGAIDYGEFMRAFIGEMNESRKGIVRKVFKKLDPHKTGSTSLLHLQKLYSANKHPLVVAGKFKQSEMKEQFLNSFADICMGSEVTFVEFEEYYEGLSIVIEKDDAFINMMRNCWGV